MTPLGDGAGEPDGPRIRMSPMRWEIMGICVAVLVATLVMIGMVPAPSDAATQFTVWPAEFAYGTPSGTFTWNATMFGFRFDQPMGPLVSLQSSLRYGSIANLTWPVSSLSGSSGSTLVADTALRVGLRTGPVGVTGFGGYGGLLVNASGPAASDGIILQNLGSRLGVEVVAATSRGLELRGTYTWIPSMTTRADISLQGPPVTAASHSGSGSGTEYEIALLFSPVPVTTIFAGYRGGTHQINWSGGGATSTTFNGFVAGVELHF